MAWAGRRGLWFIPLAVGATALLLPFGNAKYNLVMNGRYLLPLLSFVLLAEAGLAATAGRWVVSRWQAGGQRALMAAPVAALTCALILWSLLVPLGRLAEYQAAIEPANPAARDFVIQLQSVRRPGEMILIDSTLDERVTGRVSTGTTLARLLDMLDVPQRRVKLAEIGAADVSAQGQSALLVSSQPRRVERIIRGQPLALTRSPLVPLEGLRVYRIAQPLLP